MRNKVLGFAILALASVMAFTTTGAEAQQPPDEIQKTTGEAIGVSVVHPEEWVVEREPYTFDGTRGYTLWYPDTGRPHDHGGQPALRVALAYDLEPGGVDGAVREVASRQRLPVERSTVPVAREHRGVAVGTVPGSTPYTEVYVPVNGRVYRINVYAGHPGEEGLDAADRKLLRTLRFEPPPRPESSLGLPAANAPEQVYASGRQDLVEREVAAREDAEASPSLGTFSTRTGSSYPERRIYEGCWLAGSDHFFQTQHGKYANRGRWAGRRAGWSRIGVPNYWGNYTHGNLGYGRCNEPDWANDKFAIDYPLTKGDAVFSPFAKGTVTFAGSNNSHKNYGIFVVIRASNGKYVSMSAHLDSLNRGIRRGATVTKDTIIGFAGDTGDPSIPVGPVHLHQAFYRYPKFLRDGSPYGGAGLQVLFHRYVGTAAGVGPGRYKFGWTRTSYQKAKGDFISN